MGHAVARIPRRDVHVVGVERIAPDERHPVDRLHDLARPAVLRRAEHRKPLPGPLLQAAVAHVGVVRLSRLVILAADDEEVASLVRATGHPRVVVWVRRIPVQPLRDGPAGHRDRDGVGAVGRLLGVDDQLVVDRRVGGDHDGVGGHRGSLTGIDDATASAGHSRRVGVAVDPPAPLLEPLGQARQVLEGMKLGLGREVEAGAGVERRQRCPGQDPEVVEARACRGLMLLLKDVDGFAGGHEEVPIHALEVAADVFVPNDGFDPVHRGPVAFSGQQSAFGAEELLQPEIAVVERPGEMGGRAPGFAAPDRPVLEDDDPSALEREQVRRSEAGNPAPDDAHVTAGILGEGGVLRDRMPEPDRCGRTRITWHEHLLSPPVDRKKAPMPHVAAGSRG